MTTLVNRILKSGGDTFRHSFEKLSSSSSTTAILKKKSMVSFIDLLQLAEYIVIIFIIFYTNFIVKI